MSAAPSSGRRTLRCAIYTRKSSEEGLDQDFNSLDAQFEACAAFIASQKAEGWRLVPERYDDGGISGGTLERPAIQRLMGDVDAGRIDMIVVYKIDRLTRSLADFARLVDRLDAANCSFVSVTQAFNTSTSMGRLTLNVLLSFAQFEREVTSERIRDKIAASKKKGMWMGGVTPLGYDVERQDNQRGLVINTGEAEHIRTIFALYDEHECLATVAQKAKDRGIRSKRRTFKSGVRWGGAVLSHGAIHAILTNPVYAGRIRHKHQVHEGLHAAIIDDALWVRVQDKLQAHAAGPACATAPPRSSNSPRQNHPWPACCSTRRATASPPSHSKRTTKHGTRRIRYYVSRRLLKGARDDPSGWRLPALPLERAVCGAIAHHLAEAGERLFHDPDPITLYTAQDALRRVHARLAAQDGDAMQALVERITVAPERLNIRLGRAALARMLGLGPDALADEALLVETGFALRRRGVEVKIVTGAVEWAPDKTLINAIAKAHQWLGEIRQGTSMGAIGRRHGWTNSPIKQRVRLALLSPAITAAILEGRQPPELTLHKLLQTPIPLDWDRQVAVLGFTDVI